MRVKIQGKMTGELMPHMQYSIVDAETGETVRGIQKATMEISNTGSKLVLEIFDFDVDIEADAKQVAHEEKA